MVQEIIYTSAEKGLKPGSRGFCTVVSTAGMAINLAERLESMSGYRQAFPMGDPRAAQNPVCYSHVATRLAGTSLHVISRVADAGQDYTGRSNKLAHHIAIENVAGLSAGPARMLAQTGVVVDQWNGEVKTVAPRDLPAIPAPSEIPLSAWKSVTGDHGWAGAVAEQLTTSPAPVHVIFQVGTNVIGLVQEVIDLLPASQRWNITFSTYFTRLLAGTECQLRFVLNDTPEATALRNDAKARLIDLTASLPAAQGGSLVARARIGTIRPEAASTESSQAFSDLQTAAKTRPATSVSVPATRSAPTPGLPPAAGSSRPPSPFPSQFEPPRSSKVKWILIALVLVIVGGTAVTIALTAGSGADKFSQVGSRVASEAPVAVDPAVEELKRKREEERAARKKADEEKIAIEDATRKQKAEEDRLAQQKILEESMARAKADAERERAEDGRKKALEAEGPFALVKVDAEFHDTTGQWLFELPKPNPNDKAKPLPLRTGGAVVSLSFPNAAKPLFAGSDLEVDLEVDAETPSQWNAISNQGGTMVKLGTYSIRKIEPPPADPAQADTALHFEWADQASREIDAAELARWWPLQINVGDRRAILLQRSAFQPGTIPGWKELLEKNEFTFSNSPEIKVLLKAKESTAVFRAQLGGRDNALAVIEVQLHQPTVRTEEESEQDDMWSPASDVRFSALTSPLLFTDQLPKFEDIVGFCAIKLILKVDDNKGLSFRPKFSLRLKLPTKEFIESLPSIEVKQFLTNIADKNNTADVLPLLGKFGPQRTEGEVTRLKNERQAYFQTVESWLFLDSIRLPNAAKWSSPFGGLVKNANESIGKAITEDRNAKLQRAALNRLPPNMATIKQEMEEWQKKQNTFLLSMKQVGEEISITTQELTKDYATIKTQVDALQNNLLAATPRFLVTGEVDTKGADNGDSLTIYFLDTQADAAQ